jgi:N utilization substance protein B
MSKMSAEGEWAEAMGGAEGRHARRQARVLAFQTLYEADLARHPPGEVLQRLASEQGASEEALRYARELVAGVFQHRRELDELIQERAPAWPLAQMSAVDRNILRLGLFEVLHQRDKVPVGAAINEAVELAKAYGSDSSPRFVNGVLGRVVERLGSGDHAPPA